MNRKQILIDVSNRIDNPNSVCIDDVENVCVILTSSRSGSSLFKEILTQSDDTLFLDGEEEPYYILTQNTYPYTDSDKLNDFYAKPKLLNLLSSDLGKNTSEIDKHEFFKFWKNRLVLQHPYLIYEENEAFANTLITILNLIELGKYKNNSVQQINEDIIFALKNNQFYDGFHQKMKDAPSFNRIFDSKFKIEEPPFVAPKCKSSVNEYDLKTKTLILKTPQDCYRINAIKKLFPQANFKFIHLTRNVAATINGLIDGWKSDKAFFAHDVSNETQLDIEDYEISNKWWKFDLPPDWREFTNSELEHVCINQWIQAHSHILNSIEKQDSLYTLKFEDFVEDPQNVINDVTRFLNISKISIEEFPTIMATSQPEQQRWKRKQNIIENVIKFHWILFFLFG